MRVLLLFICLAVTFSAEAQSPADLLRRGQSYMENPWPNKRRPDSAVFYYNQALALSERLHDEQWINKSLLTIGNLAVSNGDLAKGKAAYFRAIERYRKVGDKRGEADAWLAFGEAMTHLNQDKLDTAENELFQVLDLYKKLGYKKLH